MSDDLTTVETVPNACERAERALRACDATALGDYFQGQSYPVSDLIADLLHFGERGGFSAEALIESALGHYESERS